MNGENAEPSETLTISTHEITGRLTCSLIVKLIAAMPERPLWSRSSRLGIYMLYPIPQELLIHRWVTPLFLSLCLAAHLHPKFDPNLHVDSQRPYRGESHKSNVWKLPALIASLRGPVLLSLPFNVILSGMMVSLALVSSLSADYLPSHGTSHLLVGDLRVFEGIHDWLESLMQSLGRKYSHTKAIKGRGMAKFHISIFSRHLRQSKRWS